MIMTANSHQMKKQLTTLAEAHGGKVKMLDQIIPNVGSAIMSFPLSEDHWLYQRDECPNGVKANVPPMPFRLGISDQITIATPYRSVTLNRAQFDEAILAAAQYGVRCATYNGAEDDFDPDAMVRNVIIGMSGYYTADGFTGDSEDSDWLDPQMSFDFDAKM